MNFKKVMSLHRFYAIKRFLHFTDDDKPTRFGKVEAFLDRMRGRFGKYWKLGPYAAYDEMLFAFKGSNPFHRCLPRKPKSNGFMLISICDGSRSTYYCVNFYLSSDEKTTQKKVAEFLFFL